VNQRNDVFKCNKCGNIVQFLHAAAAPLVCCSEKMIKQEENTVDASREKHVPVIEMSSEGIRVKVGSVPHPMEEKHYIEWIELVTSDKVYRRFLKPGDEPVACFPPLEEEFTAREYCNLHGQWINEN